MFSINATKFHIMQLIKFDVMDILIAVDVLFFVSLWKFEHSLHKRNVQYNINIDVNVKSNSSSVVKSVAIYFEH